ncbi:hypothetical protein DPMN_080845 [Dreissena polymorpha]|uniref:Uncharacterized protein n=2 Tax=Dreissena polymorpha TaxID=45954 RepID=A0A9D4BH68_DREPO|nr:hypothetical protein DPMN_080845 [Dreissena polymorpha]
MSDQPGHNPLGAPEQRGEELLQELNKNMSKFADIARSVGEMRSTIDNLQKDVKEIKRKNPEEAGPSKKLRISDSDMCQSRPSKQLQAPAVTVAESSDSELEQMDAEIDELQGYLDEESCSDEEDCDLITELTQFCTETTETGEAVSPNIAEITNKAIKNKQSEEKIKKILNRHKRPVNIEFLQVPKVDEFLWRQLKQSPRHSDFILQKSHSTLAQVAVPIIKALERIQTSKDKVLKQLLSDAFKLATNGIQKTTNYRREKLKKELQPRYRHLGNLDSSAEKLFEKIPEAIKTTEGAKQIVNMRYVPTQRKPFLGQRPNQHRWNPGANQFRRNNHAYQHKRRGNFKMHPKQK